VRSARTVQRLRSRSGTRARGRASQGQPTGPPQGSAARFAHAVRVAGRHGPHRQHRPEQHSRGESRQHQRQQQPSATGRRAHHCPQHGRHRRHAGRRDHQGEELVDTIGADVAVHPRAEQQQRGQIPGPQKDHPTDQPGGGAVPGSLPCGGGPHFSCLHGFAFRREGCQRKRLSWSRGSGSVPARQVLPRL